MKTFEQQHETFWSNHYAASLLEAVMFAQLWGMSL